MPRRRQRRATWHLDADDRAARHRRPSTACEPGRSASSSSFTGILNDKLRGFYRSTYTRRRRHRAGHRHHADAGDRLPAGVPVLGRARLQGRVRDHARRSTRRCSPSPTAPRSSATRAAGGKVAVRFADTMVMSTYLVAFVVGPLEATEPVDVDGIPLRVVHVPGKGHLTGFGLDVGAFCLRWFQQLLRHPVPERQGRPARPARLRRRRDGEPRLHHVPRERCCSSTRRRARRTSSSASPTSSPTSSPTCGSATS